MKLVIHDNLKETLSEAIEAHGELTYDTLGEVLTDLTDTDHVASELAEGIVWDVSDERDTRAVAIFSRSANGGLCLHVLTVAEADRFYSR